ncbi:Aste57867_24363, partial [Symbiodinium sp. KB8]
VLKSFGRDLQNLASRLDGHDTRSTASKVTADKLKSSHEVLRGEVEHRFETLGQLLEDTRAVADAARLSQQAEADRCTEELGELQHAAKAQAAQQEDKLRRTSVARLRMQLQYHAVKEPGKGKGKGKKDDDVKCALVEYVRGIKARKWTLQLGQTYDVGRAGGCVDVEIDHPSLSRKHCTIAITEVDSELILVALDHGSTNGTFINKSRLEKGEGVKMPVVDVKHIVFGECQNGYKFLVKDQEVDALPADGEESMPVAPKEVDQVPTVGRHRRYRRSARRQKEVIGKSVAQPCAPRPKQRMAVPTSPSLHGALQRRLPWQTASRRSMEGRRARISTSSGRRTGS